jgi:hypothetical protein
MNAMQVHKNKNKKDDKIQPKLTRRMPIRAKPYKHQIAAFNFAMEVLLGKEGKANDG